MKVREIRYQYELDDGALFGANTDMSDIDVCASYSAYADAVSAALQRMYPSAHVVVSQGPHRLEIDGLRDHAETPWASALIRNVWQAAGWLRRQVRMTLTRDQINAIFDSAETQADYIIALHKAALNAHNIDWDDVKRLDGYVRISVGGGAYIFDRAIHWDQRHCPGLLAGGGWLSRGFSSDEGLRTIGDEYETSLPAIDYQ